MSTRCVIAKKNSDGSFRAVYSHWDGYPEHNGRVLLSNYFDVNKLNSLLDEGDISCLRETVGEKHDFDDFIQGSESPANLNEWTTFYGRDRGEENIEACTFETLDKLITAAKERWAIYVYVFDGSWSFKRCSKDGDLQDLEAHLHQIDLEVCEA
jgi:hypothetical protein